MTNWTAIYNWHLHVANMFWKIFSYFNILVNFRKAYNVNVSIDLSMTFFHENYFQQNYLSHSKNYYWQFQLNEKREELFILVEQRKILIFNQMIAIPMASNWFVSNNLIWNWMYFHLSSSFYKFSKVWQKHVFRHFQMKRMSK